MNLEALRQTLAALWRKLRREAQERAQALRSWAAPEYDRVLRRTREGWAIARERVGPALAKSRAPLHVAWRRCATGFRSMSRAGGRPPIRRPACAAWSKPGTRVSAGSRSPPSASSPPSCSLDVIGREFIGPVLRFVGLDPGATGIFAAQKLSVFALVIGSFAGIGIATATGSHIVPRFAPAGCRRRGGRRWTALADVLTGLFLVGVAWFGFKFVGSSFKTDLRAPVLDWPVWPIQLFIPLGFLSAAGRYFALCRLAGAQAAAAGVPGMKALGLIGSVLRPAGAAPAAARRPARRRRLRAPVLGPRQPRGHHRGHVGGARQGGDPVDPAVHPVRQRHDARLHRAAADPHPRRADASRCRAGWRSPPSSPAPCSPPSPAPRSSPCWRSAR